MRQKIFIKQTCRALLLYFICLTIAVAIDLIFFKVKNMYTALGGYLFRAQGVCLGLKSKDQTIWSCSTTASNLGLFMSIFFTSGHFVLTFLPSLLAGLGADLLAKKGNYENYENDKVNLLSYMVFSLGNLAPIVTMWLAPKAYSAQLLAKGKTQD
ncbi:MAG: MptD family putative ECF transporter S component [Streptococcus thermophilus]